MVSYKYRIYPTKDQQNLLWNQSKLCNQLYNHLLDYKISNYEDIKKLTPSKNFKDEIKHIKTLSSKLSLKNLLPSLKKNTGDLLKNIHSQVLQEVVDRLDNAYNAFFRRVRHGLEKPGFPKFRSSKRFFTLTYPQSGYKLINNYFITRAFGNIKINFHRKYLGNIRQCEIIFEKDHFYLCITTDYIINKHDSKRVVGIDVGIKNIAALSNGEIIENISDSRYFNKIIDSTKSYRDKKCKRGSRKYKSLSNKLRWLYVVKNRKVNDFLHKTSKGLSSRFDIIVVEDLSLKKMSESDKTSLNKNLRETSLGKFISYLGYKTKRLIKVNPYNTSKRCNTCGNIKIDLKLSDRVYRCECGNISDRDINAAKNILCLGQTQLLFNGENIVFFDDDMYL